MNDRESRVKLLHEAARERILVIGGPYGTYLHGRDLTPDDYGGALYEGCPEQLNVTRPDVIEDDAPRLSRSRRRHHHDQHASAAGSIVLAEYGLQDRVARAERGGRAASRARPPTPFSTPARPRWVDGQPGPDDEVALRHRRHHLRRADRDLPRLGAGARRRRRRHAACSRRRTTRAPSRPALIGIERAVRRARLPRCRSWSPATIELTGTMLAGQSAEALATSLMHADLLTLGLNCSTGPEFMTDHMRGLAEIDGVRHVVLAERRPARRRRQLQRDAAADGGRARALRRQRLAEHRRRLLRHDVRPHRAPSPQMVDGKTPRVAPKHTPHAVLRHRLRRSDRRQPAADRRRAHERGRLAQVQAPHHARRSTKRRPRSRASR